MVYSLLVYCIFIISMTSYDIKVQQLKRQKFVAYWATQIIEWNLGGSKGGGGELAEVNYYQSIKINEHIILEKDPHRVKKVLIFLERKERTIYLTYNM